MKNKIIPALLFVLFLSVSLFGENIQVINFNELLEALKEGRQVRVIIHYKNTRLISDNEEMESPDAIGGMELKTFEYFARMSVHNPKAMIVVSETVLIGHPRYGHVYNYVRIRFYEDNEVQITAKYLTVDDYKTVMDEKFYGVVNDGKNSAGVYLYKLK